MSLKLKPKRSSLRAKIHTKLAPRFVGPFEILVGVGSIAYQLVLPPHIKIHDVFHISLLKKYIVSRSHVIDRNVIQVELEGEVSIELVRIIDQR